jgi:UDP-N-acetylglucosamine 2-epimerase (non-hydrolysing)
MRITVPVGTRPEVIKLAGVVAALRVAGHDVRCIATGQHYDPRMAGSFFEDLDCPPDETWELTGSEGERVGRLLSLAFEEIAAHPADAVLVLGDTYTAPLMAMAARRGGVGVIHLEAGLRSFNERSMEESNRKMVAGLATIHLAPTELAAGFLRREGVSGERIRVVGNPVIDALVASRVPKVRLSARRGTLLTAHRATNVDDPDRLAELARLVRELGSSAGPVTFPMHPRTRGRLSDAGMLGIVEGSAGVEVTEPLPYAELLRRLASSRLVVTDSGGLQEEAAYFGIPVVVLRKTTPRWESVSMGAAALTGLHAAGVMAAVRDLTRPAILERIAAMPCPYGDGTTAARVVEALADPGLLSLLRPREPELADGLPPGVEAPLRRAS